MALPTTPTPNPPHKSPRDHPAFYTLQPNLLTRTTQLRIWSRLIQSYCRTRRLHKLVLQSALSTPLFHSPEIRKRLSLRDAREVVEWMCGKEGEERAEWVAAGDRDKGKGTCCWVWWRRPEEWAEVLAGWVEETGQKNTVLTLYELMNGEATVDQEFHGMDPEVLHRSLSVLVKRGKAQIFGSEDQQGVKFF